MAQHVGQQFANTWLARYPRPVRCIHDNGGEFTGEDFQTVLRRMDIKDVPTTVKNPQSNAICERLHQTVANILRTVVYTHPPKDQEQAEEMLDQSLAMAMRATRASMHRILKTTPGAIAFRRDMFLDIPIIADLVSIQQRRQQIIDEETRKLNNKRRFFDYQVGQRILIRNPEPDKLDPRFVGPYTIRRVHINGTLTIQRAPNVYQRINVRRVKPYRE